MSNTGQFQFGPRKRFRKLPKKKVLQVLTENLTTINSHAPDVVLDSCKYVRLARDYGYENYRLCTYPELERLELIDSFSFYQRQFFKSAGAAVAVFNTWNGKPTSITFRATNSKDFLDFSLIYTLYGIDNMDPNFKFGDYIVLTEGVYDADVLRSVYPNTLAMLTSNVTRLQTAILKTLTNRFIVAFDNDRAGEQGFKKAFQRLDNVKKLSVYPGDKDVGELEECRVKYPGLYEKKFDYYEGALYECMHSEGYTFTLT